MEVLCSDDKGEVEAVEFVKRFDSEEFDAFEARLAAVFVAGNALLGIRGVEGLRGEALVEAVNS